MKREIKTVVNPRSVDGWIATVLRAGGRGSTMKRFREFSPPQMKRHRGEIVLLVAH